MSLPPPEKARPLTIQLPIDDFHRLPGDTPEALAARVLEVEHRIFHGHLHPEDLALTLTAGLAHEELHSGRGLTFTLMDAHDFVVAVQWELQEEWRVDPRFLELFEHFVQAAATRRERLVARA